MARLVNVWDTSIIIMTNPPSSLCAKLSSKSKLFVQMTRSNRDSKRRSTLRRSVTLKADSNSNSNSTSNNSSEESPARQGEIVLCTPGAAPIIKLSTRSVQEKISGRHNSVLSI